MDPENFTSDKFLGDAGALGSGTMLLRIIGVKQALQREVIVRM